MTDDDLDMLFFAESFGPAERLRAGGKLVHYTSAEAAARIIGGREVWLRNALLMNDFSEIEHGLGCLWAAWASAAGGGFKTWLDRVFPGFREQFEQLFDQHSQGLKIATFMMSLSEHDATEDVLGRLSMWRAYGGSCGVALVLNPLIFTSSTDVLKAFSAPVRYLDQNDFVAWFGQWTARIIAQESALVAFSPDRMMGLLFHAFRVFVLCTKHPGFREEREWRIFHSPLLDGTSDWLRKENEIVGSLPQEVIKIQLRDDPSQGVEGIEPDILLRRLIIGPTAHPLPVYHSLYNLMVDAGVQDVAQKIVMSQIPLRN